MNGETSTKATVMKFEYVISSRMLFLPIVFGNFYCEDMRKRSHFIAFFGVVLENTSKTCIPMFLFQQKKKYLGNPQKICKKHSNSRFFQDFVHI